MTTLLNRRNIPLLGLLVSGGLLLGAYAFQYIGGLEPCMMCYWQRHAHKAVLLVSLIGLALILWRKDKAPEILIGLAVAAALFVSFGYAFFHVGVEYHWWRGPGCGVDASVAETLAAPGSLLDALNEPIKAPSCDEVAWSMLGLSMAGWNALISAASGLAALFMLTRKTDVTS